MIISNRHKFVFVSTPKAGTHAMFQYLLANHKCKRQAGSYHCREIPVECKDYFVFTTVRNPFARAVSCWWHLLFRADYRSLWRPRIGSVGFLPFMRYALRPEMGERGDLVLYPQYKWLEDVPYDRALHLENLNAEFSELSFAKKRVRIPQVLSSGRRANKSSYGDWREIMTNEGAKLVREWAGEDFDKFGYNLDWTNAN